jgi:carbon-monoxide dehydrogenase medium subunit
VKPVDFDLHRPETMGEALELLATFGEDGKVLAGGQSLVPLMNFRLARPEHVIDIGRLTALTELRPSPAEVVIGSMVRQARAEKSPEIAARCPLVAAALPNIAHPPIRARGTIGGNMAHADPAAELPSVAVAVGATFVAVSTRGRREIPAAQFFDTYLTTALEPDELLTEIRFPAAAPHTGAVFLEVARRRGDFALVGVAAQVTVGLDSSTFPGGTNAPQETSDPSAPVIPASSADGAVKSGSEGGRSEAVIADVRLCVSGVSGAPFRCDAAERLLRGRTPSEASLQEAADSVMAAIEPPGDLHATADYRRHLAGVLIRRATAQAYHRAAGVLRLLRKVAVQRRSRVPGWLSPGPEHRVRGASGCGASGCWMPEVQDCSGITKIKTEIFGYVEVYGLYSAHKLPQNRRLPRYSSGHTRQTGT